MLAAIIGPGEVDDEVAEAHASRKGRRRRATDAGQEVHVGSPWMVASIFPWLISVV
jgi:hypothetical protein